MTLVEFIRGRAIVGPWTDGPADRFGKTHDRAVTGQPLMRGYGFSVVAERGQLWTAENPLTGKSVAVIPGTQVDTFDDDSDARQFVDDWIRTTGADEYVLIEDIARAVKDGSVEV